MSPEYIIQQRFSFKSVFSFSHDVPTMTSVIHMINSDSSTLPAPSKPGFFYAEFRLQSYLRQHHHHHHHHQYVCAELQQYLS